MVILLVSTVVSETLKVFKSIICKLFLSNVWTISLFCSVKVYAADKSLVLIILKSLVASDKLNSFPKIIFSVPDAWIDSKVWLGCKVLISKSVFDFSIFVSKVFKSKLVSLIEFILILNISIWFYLIRIERFFINWRWYFDW